MVMAMLGAGGVPAVDGSDPLSGELSGGIDAASHLPAHALAGRAVKLLDAALYPTFTPPAVEHWRIVWTDRDGREQSRSMVKFLRGLGVSVPLSAARRIEVSYRQDRPRALAVLHQLGPVHVDSYERALADPASYAADLAAFLGPALPLDVDRAAGAVHQRNARCARGLDFELGRSAS